MGTRADFFKYSKGERKKEKRKAQQLLRKVCSNALKQQNSSTAYLKAGTEVSNSSKILQWEDGA